VTDLSAEAFLSPIALATGEAKVEGNGREKRVADRINRIYRILLSPCRGRGGKDFTFLFAPNDSLNFGSWIPLR